MSAITSAVTVVIPTLGGHETLRRVLDGLAAQTVDPQTFEVIVVADHAEPSLPNIDAAIAAAPRPYAVRRLQGGRPGASANRNAGWQAAQSELILFTDDDTVPVPTWIAEHLRVHEQFPAREVACLGHIRWAEGIEVTPFMRWLDRGLQFDVSSLRGEEASWAQLYTANASIKRSMLELVGGYDEERLPYLYEDLDWGYRAREHGLRVRYNRDAIVDHWRPTTLETWKRRMPQLARAELNFCGLHPDIDPYFYNLFSVASRTPPGAGRALRLVRYLPRRTPVLTRAIWDRAAAHWLQELAPAFMSAWDQASRELGT